MALNLNNEDAATQYEWEFGLIRPGAIPKTPIIWPTLQHNSSQIQQTKGSAKPQVSAIVPTTMPGQSSVAPRTTPQHVSNVRVITRPTASGKAVTVQFDHPSGDPYFSGARVYLKKSGQEPVLVASGAKSPLTFTASNDQAPHSIHVTSVGNWGETDIVKSPSAPLRLSGATVSSPTVFQGTSSGVPAPPAGVTDGLIHSGANPWESDPAYVLIREDFHRYNNSTIFSTVGASAPIGNGWMLAGTGTVGGFSSAGAIPGAGSIWWENSSTAGQNMALVECMFQGEDEGGNLDYNVSRALFDTTGWWLTWIFKVENPRNAGYNGSVSFDATKKSIYVGLGGATATGTAAGSIARPDVFFGVRYDTSVTAPAIGDTTFVLEGVVNSTFSTLARHNTQGTTLDTTIAPLAGTWHRLDIYSTTVGQIVMVFDNTHSLTVTVPTLTVTSTGGGGSRGGYAYVDILPSATVPISAFGPDSIITVSGFTGAASGLNGTHTVSRAIGGGTSGGPPLLWDDLTAITPVGGIAGVSIVGRPSVYPVAIFGNDDTATPAGNSMAMFVDFFSYIWNPGVRGGSGTPDPTKPRYF